MGHKALVSTPGPLKPRWRYEEAPECLSLAVGEVQVEVYFSGMNFADYMMTLGMYPDAPKKVFVPGYEFSGVVKAVGKEVTQFKEGDLVLGGSRFGGFQEKINVSAWQLKKVPTGLTLEEGAALPVSFLTSFFAFHSLARVRAKDQVMIDCASGALGSLSLQLLKKVGVEKVYGLTSQESKFDLILKRGAIPMTRRQWESSTHLVDVILNSHGGRTLKEDYLRLAPLGRLVGIGGSGFIDPKRPGKNMIHLLSEFMRTPRFFAHTLMNDNKAVMGLNVLHLFQEEILRPALEEFEPKNFSANVDQIFMAKDFEMAFRYMALRQSKGKILLSWKK